MGPLNTLLSFVRRLGLTKSLGHSRGVRLLVAVAVGVLATIGAGVGVAVGGSDSNAGSTSSQTTASSTTCLPGQPQSWCDSLPTDKGQALSTYDAMTATGASTPNVVPPPPITTAAAPQVGVGEYGTPVSPQIASVTEPGYRRLATGVMQLAMAGVSGTNPTQGVVVVFTENWDPTIDDVDLTNPNYSTQVYDSPSAAGRLTITSASGGLVQLTSADGIAFTFNLATMAYQ